MSDDLQKKQIKFQNIQKLQQEVQADLKIWKDTESNFLKENKEINLFESIANNLKSSQEFQDKYYNYIKKYRKDINILKKELINVILKAYGDEK